MRFILIWIVLLSGCNDFPKDPKKSYKRIENGVIRVGYSINDEWIQQGPKEIPTGIEPEIIKNFANQISAQIKWVNASEEQLVKMMKNEQIDIIIAGLTKKSPWKKRVSFTSVYLEKNGEKHVIAVSQGENKLLTQLEKHLYQNQAK